MCKKVNNPVARMCVNVIIKVLFLEILVATVSCVGTDSKAAGSERTNDDRIPRQISLLEDEMCLGNYDVSEGSIIRTHDSQKLGAKYLNETDEGQGIKAREECFLLCCRTQHCNVAVFEEKNTGSCYLFDCGPTEDFRCKFTTQPQYTSAILRKPVLQLVNQHENELTQLRTPERGRDNGETINNIATRTNSGPSLIAASEKKTEAAAPPQTTVATSAQNPPSQPTANASIITPPEPQALTQPQSACHRNQFECKTSKECIAIYNACDGIPQCADGSDEGSELNCPPDASNPSLIPAKSNQLASAKSVLQVNPVRTDPYGASGYMTNGNNYDHNQNHFAPGPIMQHANHGMPQQEDMRVVPPSQQLIPNRGNENVMGKNQGVPPYGMEPQQQMQPALNIFAHKDGGIMDDTYANQGQQRHASYWKPSSFDYSGADSASAVNYNQDRNAYNSPMNGGNPNENSGMQQQQYQFPSYPMQQGQSQQVHPYPNNNKDGMQSNVQIVPIAKQQSPYAPQPISYSRNGSNQGYNGNPTGYSNGWNTNQAVPLNSSPNRLIPPGDSRNGPVTPPTSNILLAQNLPVVPAVAQPSPTSAGTVSAGVASTIGQQSEKGLQDLSNLQLPQTMSKLSAEIRDFAAESENLLVDNRAGPGAVLAFVAGIIMSVAMVVIVGCRLRRIGTRRRGKNRLDPDFLVDGMYL